MIGRVLTKMTPISRWFISKSIMRVSLIDGSVDRKRLKSITRSINIRSNHDWLKVTYIYKGKDRSIDRLIVGINLLLAVRGSYVLP